jgi:hypothetical protein
VESPYLSGHSNQKFASMNQVRSGLDVKGLSGSIASSGPKISPGMI